MPDPCFAPFQPAGSQREGHTFPALPDEVQFLIVDVAKENGGHMRVGKIRRNTFSVTVWSAVAGGAPCDPIINELLDRLPHTLADAWGVGPVR